MGVAAYNRGSRAIREQISRDMRPVEFEMMDRLNALEKYPDAGTPFMPIQFIYDDRGFWVAEYPKTGFGYFYSMLAEAVKRWRVTIVGFENGKWLADPMPKEKLTIEQLMSRR